MANQFISSGNGQVGVVLVKVVRPKYAVAELVSGEAPQRNDIARPEKQGANP